MKIEILLMMLFLHVADDFYLQGVFARLKQKEFWKENAPGEIYRNDYKVALAIHGFSWACMVMLPLWYFGFADGWFLLGMIAALAIPHSLIDNAKANLNRCNLVQDQLAHMFQILAVWALCCFSR